MTTLWATIILLGVLITIHEYGHFIAARSVGIRVERFSIGIPPRFLTIRSIDDALEVSVFFFKFFEGRIKWQPIFQRKISKFGRQGSGTEYVIALLPLGGYVKMAGMIDESMDTNIQYEADEFMSKPLWSKLWVLSAGVIMNTLLALMIFATLGYYQGVQDFKDEPVIGELQDNYPAQRAGLLSGDRIIDINNQTINTWEGMTKVIHALPNSEITLKILREGTQSKLKIKTTYRLSPVKNGIDTLGVIGIAPEIFYVEMNFLDAIFFGWDRTLASFGMIIMSLKMVGSGAASVSDFGGPIMIAQLAGQTADAGLVPYLTLMALLSVNLAFLNILPIPGLDGGHIFIHLIEGLIRRPLTLKTRITIQQIGMAFILMLFITIMFNDITRLFN
jgi:regulator of sigma E protease